MEVISSHGVKVTMDCLFDESAYGARCCCVAGVSMPGSIFVEKWKSEELLIF
ncbi:MAG: hypothetical protein ACLSBH_17210 [Coprobacillus cateniformis]